MVHTNMVTTLFLLLLPSSLIAADHGVYLSINSLAFTRDNGDIVKRRLELNWFGASPQDGDTISLLKDGETILEIVPSDYEEGFFVTDIVLPYPNTDQLGYDR